MQKKKGEGTIFQKKNGDYYFQIKISGKRITKSLKTKNKDTAEINAKKYRQKYLTIFNAKEKEELAVQVAIAKKILKKEESLPVDLLWGEYLKSPRRKASDQTAQKYEYKISRFLDWLHKLYPSILTVFQITADIATEYAGDLWSSGISEKTYNDHIEIIRMVIRDVTGIGDSENPFNKKNIPKKTAIPVTRKEFSEDEVKNILNSFDQDFYLMNKEEIRALFNIACWTAQRLKDCVSLRWDAIKSNEILFVPSKTRKYKKTISIPIHPDLRLQLETALSWKSNEYVLPKTAERYKRNAKGIINDISKVLRLNGFQIQSDEVTGKQRKNKANQYGLHSFRHSFVSFCDSKGISRAIVQEWIGDGSPVIDKHYSHIGKEVVSSAITALPSIHEDKLFSTRNKLHKMIDTAKEEELKKILSIFGI